MKLNLAIVDDHAEFREFLAEQILEITKSFSDILVVCQEIVDLDALNKNAEGVWPWDVIFLDIDLKDAFSGKNGLYIAKMLRNNNYQGQIVFTTRHQNHALQAYELSAFRYLAKPIQVSKLKECLNSLITRQRQHTWTFITKTKRLCLQTNHSYYFEANNHLVSIVCATNSIEIVTLLQTIQKTLFDNFVMCHRSYIVNFDHVSYMTREMLFLDNEEKVPLSRTYYPELKRRYLALHEDSI